ncbi:MAG: peptidoglycan editing factor PgeF [Lachnospiraceae bacterium]|nr:peptidoglycan editing factor PgeF [Lachnospiraceae bacterium]
MEGHRITEPDGNGVRVVQFPALSVIPGILHAFSTREGGVSDGIFSSMNLGFGRGDDDANVQENFRRFLGSVGAKPEDAVFTKQTHGTVVRRATYEDRGIGLFRPIPYDSVDGLITDEENVALIVFTADCVPVYLCDPVRRAIGLCHAGWRGTVAGIAGITVNAMHDTFGSEPSDIVAVVGPSLCHDCFEVGEEVADEFVRAYGEETVFLKTGSKPHVDLWKANAMDLVRAGVSADHVSIGGLCTMCRPKLLFSHRATAGKRGSNAAVLMLRSER